MIRRTREADGQAAAANARRQRVAVGGFGDEVDVIGLDGKLDDTEVGARRRGQGATYRREHASAP
jgi:hypothetical protein